MDGGVYGAFVWWGEGARKKWVECHWLDGMDEWMKGWVGAWNAFVHRCRLSVCVRMDCWSAACVIDVYVKHPFDY